MIIDKDRSYYIGASDTDKVVGNWRTVSWRRWWEQKMGVRKYQFENKYTRAGNSYEHRILESLNIPGMVLDEQIIREELRLRVNYDGTTKGCIYECKTFQREKGFQLHKKYVDQVQVQMFARCTYQAKVVAYGLVPNDYVDLHRPVDPTRIKILDIPYNANWISSVYLPKLQILAEHLKRGTIP